MALPNFLGIGTARSGTTALYSKLGLHPDVFVPTRSKEQNFFNNRYHLGVPYYEISSFGGVRNEKAIGEFTPNYLYDPLCAEKIATTLGLDMKFIVCLRSPAERAYSHYMMYFNWFWESETFERALGLEESRLQHAETSHLNYFKRSRYAEQLSRYMDKFHLGQMFLIEFQEDYLEKEDITLGKLFEFLEVDPDRFTGADPNLGRNNSVETTAQYFETAQSIRLNNPQGESITMSIEEDSLVIFNLVGGLYFPFGAQEFAGVPVNIIRHPSEQIRNFWEKRQQEKPPAKLSREEYIRINNEVFHEDISRLEDLLGRDFSHWLK
ncbi:MAG: sulfotransferase domain-containing protein [Pseudomonadales bacterium]|nr:sulfotransferase domain-containing protein [Pseudomonadales bacterium]